jgi:hypothetical protein
MIDERSIEVSVDGKWERVPALNIQGKNVIIRGTLIKTAVVHDEEWQENAIGDPVACVNELKKRESHGFRPDIFTFAAKRPCKEAQYSYPMELESVAAADTRDFNRWWENLPQETRKNVRRSKKRGVTIEVVPFTDDLVEGIAGVNNEVSVRQGRPNKHFGKSLNQVKKDHESFLDRSDFLCAYYGDELIGYLKLVYMNDIASILNLVAKTCHQDKRPANLLLTKAVELCSTKGVAELIYGRYYYGNKRNSSLLDFKIRHGFRELLRPRFYVPLTTWGAVCVKLRLYRGLIGILPGPITEAAAAARSGWYHVKTRSAGVAQ